MSLFNEFHNKNINHIIKYYNDVNNGLIDPQNAEELSSFLSGDEQQLTSPDLINTILNLNENGVNLNLFFEEEDSGGLIPIWNFGTNLPLFTTAAERTWLKYVLNDPKTELFLNPHLISKLKYELNQEPLPVLDQIINIRRFTTTEPKQTVVAKHHINAFLKCINNKQHIEIICNNLTRDILPYRLYYNWETDLFSVLSYNDESDDIEFININDIDFCDISEKGTFDPSEHNNRTYEDFFSSLLNRHMCKEPITVKVINHRLNSDNQIVSTDADNRFSHLFSDYEKICNIDEDGYINVEINYYDFQYQTLLQKILEMGKYIEVTKPKAVRQDIIQILRQKVRLYN